ncbi:Presilphiperfolan-8-beta-ol synthase [Madurella mycetomatis]|uniref:Terpene synthase n=1 Tax=Madurella mycetomatis TaxID=100816 RepID=A0A175WA85_9PEZI|nr:Presilphiperfolan-8-beta-ol synthase [Madurella mycetomatis]
MADSTILTPPPSPEAAEKFQDHAEGRWIKLPEALFSSIMSVEPEINPLYGASKALSDDWLRSALRMDDKTASVWSRLDIAYMSAICAPRSDIETLKLLNDWNGWVFAFDDPFDEGIFAHDPIKAAEELIYTLAILDDVHPIVSAEENSLRHTLQSCWMRFRQRSTPSLQYRWKRHLTLYCIGVLRQVGVQHGATRLTVEEYMDMRAGCVGAYPCIGLMEFAEGIDLPLYVADHPSLEAISRITCDLVTLQNDLCSYRKDLIKGEDSNIIFILKGQGMSDQEAVDHIGEMLYDCYRRWFDALRNMPFWGEKIDRDVVKFVNGCRNIALGNLHWSLYTPRYLGTDGPEVRRTRMMRLP